MKKQVLITGVNGFIGQALWRYLRKKQSFFSVFGIDIHKESQEKNIFCCNLSHSLKLQSILTDVRPDYIFHLAGGRILNDKKSLNVNILITKCLLDAIKGIAGLHPRVIIPGSAAEYGQMPKGKRLITEKDTAAPLSWYGFVKLMQTNLGLVYARQGMDVVVARMFNILGENTPSQLVVGQFAQQIIQIERKEHKPIMQTKNLDGKRDFLDIEDIVQALLLIAQKGRSGEIYNVSSGQSMQIKTLLKKIVSYARVKGITIKESKNEGSKSFDMISSNAKLKAATGWSPKVSINQSIKKTLQSYR